MCARLPMRRAVRGPAGPLDRAFGFSRNSGWFTGHSGFRPELTRRARRGKLLVEVFESEPKPLVAFALAAVGFMRPCPPLREWSMGQRRQPRICRLMLRRSVTSDRRASARAGRSCACSVYDFPTRAVRRSACCRGLLGSEQGVPQNEQQDPEQRCPCQEGRSDAEAAGQSASACGTDRGRAEADEQVGAGYSP